MGIFKNLAKWFVQSMWPWVVKNIWPELQRHVIDLFLKLMRSFKEDFEKRMSERSRAREEAAKSKAAEAEQKAAEAHTAAEAEKLRAEAKQLREFAEQLRQQNDQLKADLEEAIARSETKFKTELESLDIENLINEVDDSTIKVAGSSKVLRLPAQEEEK